MREIYIEILKILEAKGQSENCEELAKLLIVLNYESAPERDQDIVDLLSEFYIFVVHGYSPDRADKDAIKNWEDLRTQIRALE